MRALIVVALLLSLCGAAGAWVTSKNPDQAASIGWGVHGGRLPGFTSEYSRFTEFGADVRVPVTNNLSLKVDFAETTVGNAPLGVPTTAIRFGGEFRVYLCNL